MARKAIKNIIDSQDAILKTYGGGTNYLCTKRIAKRQELDSSNRETGADEIIPLTSFSLHLKRNYGDVVYFHTTEIYLPPKIWIWPLAISYEIDRKSKRWLQQDSRKFHKQIIKIMAYKRSNSYSNKGYPVGKRLLGLEKWPDIKTIACACAYNKKGPMFPKENDTSFKIPYLEYINSISGGWHAQLVPAKDKFKH